MWYYNGIEIKNERNDNNIIIMFVDIFFCVCVCVCVCLCVNLASFVPLKKTDRFGYRLRALFQLGSKSNIVL